MAAVCVSVPTLVVDAANPSTTARLKLPTCDEVEIQATRVEEGTVLRLTATDQSIQTVESYPRVDSLFLADNAIASFNGSQPLKELDLSNNRLTSLERIRFPPTLERLFLDFNPLDSFTTADFPSSLTDLYFRKSGLRSLASFAFPEQLYLLDLSGNTQLASLQGLQLPPSLSTFECSNCGVTAIEGVVFPATLTTLKITGKAIASFTVRESDMPQLRSANLQFESSSIDACDDASATLTEIQPTISACVYTDKDFANKYVASRPSQTSSASYSPSSDATGQPSTANTSSSSGGSTSTIALVAGIVLAAVVVGAAIVLVFHRRRRHKKIKTPTPETPPSSLKPGSHHLQSKTLYHSDTGANSNASGFLDNDVRNDPQLIPYRLPREELVVIREIARGGHGVVYHAKLYSQDVVVKQVLPIHANTNDTLSQFMDEIRLYASLDHPKVVHFVGVSWTNLLDLSLVMEFMPRGDLHRLLRTHKSVEWLHDRSHVRCKASIALDVVEALVYLHSFASPIVHRDLKAKNVLLSTDYTAKLCDFGVSREAKHDETMTGGVGTIAWIAPEVLQGERYAEKADMYSFGILLCEMDACDHPYKGNRLQDPSLTDAKIAYLVSTASLRPRLSSGCPLAVQQLIGECLSHDPAKRPTAPELHYSLRRVRDSAGENAFV